MTTARGTAGRKSAVDKRSAVSKPETHKWEFKARFRRSAFGWKSQPAIKRVKEALSEIKKVSKTDPVLAAEGAVISLERVSPALEQVDSSSGAIGSAVNHAVEQCAGIISRAPTDDAIRAKWLERLWEAHEADRMPYIESLADYWGELCASKQMASHWADELIELVRQMWTDRKPGDCFHGTTVCLSALLKAERYQEIFDLLAMKDAPRFWDYQQFAVRALAAMGRKADAIIYAENCRNDLNNSWSIACVCEDILLSSGFADEAYDRYAMESNQNSSYIGTFRAISKKYPHKQPVDILNDLVNTTPGEEGKWFATAKDLGLFDLAIQLAAKSPCDPRTLTRAARDYVDENPAFALRAGFCALHWLSRGYGYDVTTADAREAYGYTLKAAQLVGATDQLSRDLNNILSRADKDNIVVRAIGPAAYR